MGNLSREELLEISLHNLETYGTDERNSYFDKEFHIFFRESVQEFLRELFDSDDEILTQVRVCVLPYKPSSKSTVTKWIKKARVDSNIVFGYINYLVCDESYINTIKNCRYSTECELVGLLRSSDKHIKAITQVYIKEDVHVINVNGDINISNQNVKISDNKGVVICTPSNTSASKDSSTKGSPMLASILAFIKKIKSLLGRK